MLERLVKRYIEWIIKYATAVVVVFFLVAVAAATWFKVASPLKLDTDFTTLLPDDLPAVLESRRISGLVGSTDYLMVAVDSPVPQDNVAFADEIAAKLQEFPELELVTIEEDKSFFRDNRLLYIDIPDLEEMTARAKARYKYEKKIRNPFYVALDDEKPPSVEVDDIIDKYVTRLKERGANGIMDDRNVSDSGGIDLGDRYATKDGKIITVTARPSKPATDMAFVKKIVAKTERAIEESNPHRNPQMRAEVVGSYRNRNIEYHYIIDDIFKSLALALVLILLITVAYFRRLRAVALVFVPLIVGIILTMSITALTLGRLNMTTALIFAVILGLGIDIGVHLAMRYLDERARGRTLEESLSLALQRTGKAIVTAGLTTAGGLAVLILAKFKGFSEFGIIATLGIGTCLAVYSLLLPSMVVVWEKVSVPKPWRNRKDGTYVPLKPVSKLSWVLRAALIVVLSLSVFGVVSAFNLEFEYNFKNLRGNNVSSSIKYGRTLGQGNSPVVAVLPTARDAHAFTRHLESIIDNDHERTNLLKRAFSLYSFVPENQDEKFKRLEDLQYYIDKALNLKNIKPETSKELNKVRQWTEASAITEDNLPEWVKDKFREKDGTIGRMVYLYPRADEWIINEIEKFYKQYGIIEMDDGRRVRPTASSFIMVEVVRAVIADGWLMFIVSSLVVFVVLLIDQRSFKRALLIFSPLAVGMLWTAGAMHLLGIKIGLYNMLVLPTLLGIGVDASVHLYHAYKEHGPGSLRHVLGSTGGAILVAAGTTGVGFVGMTIVSHAGLRSIGILAVIGILACLAGALITMPLILAILESRRAKLN